MGTLYRDEHRCREQVSHYSGMLSHSQKTLQLRYLRSSFDSEDFGSNKLDPGPWSIHTPGRSKVGSPEPRIPQVPEVL
jgi:hypothetical protein